MAVIPNSAMPVWRKKGVEAAIWGANTRFHLDRTGSLEPFKQFILSHQTDMKAARKSCHWFEFARIRALWHRILPFVQVGDLPSHDFGMFVAFLDHLYRNPELAGSSIVKMTRDSKVMPVAKKLMPFFFCRNGRGLSTTPAPIQPPTPLEHRILTAVFSDTEDAFEDIDALRMGGLVEDLHRKISDWISYRTNLIDEIATDPETNRSISIAHLADNEKVARTIPSTVRILTVGGPVPLLRSSFVFDEGFPGLQDEEIE